MLKLKVCKKCGNYQPENSFKCSSCGALFISFRLNNYDIGKKLVIINCVIFALMQLKYIAEHKFDFFMNSHSYTLYNLGAADSISVYANQEYWRLVSAIFLHANLMHIFFNMIILNLTAKIINVFYGPRAVFSIFIFAGITGNLLSIGFGESIIGSSGGVFGLMGAIVAEGFIRKDTLRHGFAKGILVAALVMIALGFFFQNISNMAHIGGFVGGGLITGWMIIAPGFLKKLSNTVLFYFCLILTLIALLNITLGFFGLKFSLDSIFAYI